MTAAQSEIPVMAGEISTRVVVGRGGYPLAAVALLFVDQIQGRITDKFFLLLIFVPQGRLSKTPNCLIIFVLFFVVVLTIQSS